MLSTTPRCSGSPATFTTLTVSGTPSTSTSALIAEGTVLINVTSPLPPAKSIVFATTHTDAPTVSGTKHSYTAKSKFSDVENSVRCKAEAANDSFAQCRKL